ncbi:MAG TPA: DUF58 domain-containing protein [Candidatus Dormibacteraeota bacterium]|nr:DUF58 domain-containing protein [Candidatus Dormibacteraeota bacterium]
MIARSSPAEAIRRALLNGKRRPRMPGGSPTSRRGDGYEFVELREYVAGDDVRRIDWAASARTGELQTRVILEDVALSLAAILDDSPSMQVGRNRALVDAGRESVRTWYDAAAPDDRCVRIVGEVMHPAGPQRGAASAAAAMRASGPFDLAQSLHVARTALRPGAALLAVSDWFDLADDADGLLHALGRRCDCTMLVARDPWFDGLPLSGIVRLRGAEGGVLRGFIGAPERARFAAAVREREGALLERFAGAGWRTGLLHEGDGVASLAAAFGVGFAKTG